MTAYEGISDSASRMPMQKLSLISSHNHGLIDFPFNSLKIDT